MCDLMSPVVGYGTSSAPPKWDDESEASFAALVARRAAPAAAARQSGVARRRAERIVAFTALLGACVSLGASASLIRAGARVATAEAGAKDAAISVDPGGTAADALRPAEWPARGAAPAEAAALTGLRAQASRSPVMDDTQTDEYNATIAANSTDAAGAFAAKSTDAAFAADSTDSADAANSTDPALTADTTDAAFATNSQFSVFSF